jgi:hypothetical protein
LLADIFASLSSSNLPGREQLYHMPSLFRFLTVLGILGALVFGGLFAVAVLLEPEQRDMSTSVPGVKVRR